MGSPRWRGAKTRDWNERHVVDSLRKAGYRVFRIDEPADLIVLCPGCSTWNMLEVKNPAGGNRKTPAQKRLPAHVLAAIIEIRSASEFLRSPRCSCSPRAEGPSDEGSGPTDAPRSTREPLPRAGAAPGC